MEDRVYLSQDLKRSKKDSDTSASSSLPPMLSLWLVHTMLDAGLTRGGSWQDRHSPHLGGVFV